MGLLLDLLGAAGGEGSLPSSLGRWRQAISALVDDLTNQSTGDITILQNQINSLLVPLDVIETMRSGSDQSAIGANVTILLNSILFQQGSVAYDPTTGIYTLVPGKLYELSAQGYVYLFSDSGSGELAMSWVDANTNVPLATNVLGVFHPMSMNPALGTAPSVRCVFKPASASQAQVKLRTVSAVGTASIAQTAFGCVVKQLR